MKKFAFILAAAIACMAVAAPSAFCMTDEEIIQEIQSLKDRITRLEQMLQEKQASDGAELQVEEVQFEEEMPDAGAEAPTAGRALQLPDISVVGNVIGLASNDDADPDANQFTLQEMEVALQSWVYPSIRADVILSMESDEDFSAFLEEGYATITNIGSTRFGSRLGKLRAPIGKYNQYHSHQLPYADTPTVFDAFLGNHGLIVQGAELAYLFPTKNFVNLQFGQWRPTTHSHEHEHEGEDHEEPVRLEGTTRIARLWTSSPVGDLAEFEFGTSYGDSPDAQIYGVDLTFKRWPSAFRRLYLLGELLFLKGENDEGSDTRYGYYILGAYQPDKYWEYGARYDWTEFAYPLVGRASAGTAFLTRRLNETTYARLQLKRANVTGIGGINEAFLQFVFGFGPHAHPLQ